MIKLPETLSEKEIIQLIKVTKKESHKLAFSLGFYQGMRISEIVGARKRLSLCHKKEFIRTIVKENNQTKSIYLCSECHREWLYNQSKFSDKDWQIPPLGLDNLDFGQKLIRIKQGKGSKDRNIPIMPEIFTLLSRKKKLFPIESSIRGLQLSFKRSLELAELKKYHSFHTLRHSCGTWLLNVKKWDIRLVQQFLGHSRLDTTMIYTHVSATDLLKEAWG